MIRLGFSSCPNDTFIFAPIVHSLIDLEGLMFRYEIHDVETLNKQALQGIPDMVKISYHAFLHLPEKYLMLNSGNAMGSGVGPLLISKEPIPKDQLYNKTVAVPGDLTTAHLLLNFAYPEIMNKKIMVFHEIEDAILSGVIDAGVIIHENRFTYEKKGLIKICDLGEFWEQKKQVPIPLGGIAVKRSLGETLISSLNRIMHRSVKFALENPEMVMDFVRKHAQEMDPEVMKQHISLYVNSYTVDLGSKGREAVLTLTEEFKKLSC